MKWRLYTSWCGDHQLDPVNCPIGTVLEFLQASFSLKFMWWPLRPTTCLSVVSQWVDTPSYMFPPEAEASSQIANVMWWIRMLFHCLESSALPFLRLEWANAHIRWRLALWRGVLFMDESWFSLYRADGRLHLWHHMGKRFADVNVVDWVAHGGGGVMVWAGVCYGQWTQVHFIDVILNAQRYRDEILRPIVVPLTHNHHLMLQQ